MLALSYLEMCGVRELVEAPSSLEYIILNLLSTSMAEKAARQFRHASFEAIAGVNSKACDIYSKSFTIVVYIATLNAMALDRFVAANKLAGILCTLSKLLPNPTASTPWDRF